MQQVCQVGGSGNTGRLKSPVRRFATQSPLLWAPISESWDVLATALPN